MRFHHSVLLWAVVYQASNVEAFSTPSRQTTQVQTPRMFATALASEGSAAPSKADKLREEGGLFSFNTKYGALNPFAIYYGTVAILLGIPWFLALALYQFFRLITGGRIDKQRLIPILINQLWGTTLMRLTRSTPKIENHEVLKKFFKENYKIIAKAELSKVPILGKAIDVGGHVRVERSNKRSQLQTLKTGIQYLKDGVNLCTFPEGTRSRDGKVQKFKNGAFKMAYKAEAPVIPLSIVGGHKVNPSHWMFINKPAHSICKVVVNEPVESKGITEEELADKVRQSIINGLPEDQRP